MAESMSRGVALTFSSLCLATIKKSIKTVKGVCVWEGGSVHVAVCAFVCALKAQG